MLDVTLGLQLNFAERAHIRLEGGIHNMLFYGVSWWWTFLRRTWIPFALILWTSRKILVTLNTVHFCDDCVSFSSLQ